MQTFDGSLAGVSSITVTQGAQGFGDAYSGPLTVGNGADDEVIAGNIDATLVMNGTVTGSNIVVKSDGNLVLNGADNTLGSLDLQGTLTIGDETHTSASLTLDTTKFNLETGTFAGNGTLTLTAAEGAGYGVNSTFTGALNIVTSGQQTLLGQTAARSVTVTLTLDRVPLRPRTSLSSVES